MRGITAGNSLALGDAYRLHTKVRRQGWAVSGRTSPPASRIRPPGQTTACWWGPSRPEVFGRQVESPDHPREGGQAHRPEPASLEPRDRGLIQSHLEGELTLCHARRESPAKDRLADDRQP